MLNEEGMCWEDENSNSLNEALHEAAKWLSSEIQDSFGEVSPKIY